jgi:hypothetical protein
MSEPRAILRPVCWLRGHKISAKLPTIRITVNPPAEIHELDWQCERCGYGGREVYAMTDHGGLYGSEGPL